MMRSRLTGIALALILALTSLFRAEAARQELADSVASAPADSVAAPQAKPGRIKPGITPVDIDREKPQQPVLHYYDKHGNPLKEPVLFLAELDTTVKASPKSPYPLYNGIDAGVNFADAVMMLAGQKHGSFDVCADVSLHNWFFPVLEAGVGYGSVTPDDGNFSYKGKLAPYFKLGIDYNFLYKSNPDYRLTFGLRAGMSHFSYDITDITIKDPYWGETQKYDIKGISATSFYGEAVLGLKVKIYKGFGMGWSVRYHFLFHTNTSVKSGAGSAPGGDPWFIPGYGSRSPLRVTYSLIWTLPVKRREIRD